MKIYKIPIIEVIQGDLWVEANSEQEAREKMHQAYDEKYDDISWGDTDLTFCVDKIEEVDK